MVQRLVVLEYVVFPRVQVFEVLLECCALWWYRGAGLCRGSARRIIKAHVGWDGILWELVDVCWLCVIVVLPAALCDQGVGGQGVGCPVYELAARMVDVPFPLLS